MPGSRRRGGHVHVRPVRLADEAEFLRLVRGSRVLHRPWSYPPATHQAFREHVGDGGDSDARFVVCRNDDGAIVGYFGLGQIFYGKFRNAYLGYYAFEPFAGQGYMREGLELVLRYAFGDLHLHRVQASIQPGNERSIALVRGAGFRKEGPRAALPEDRGSLARSRAMGAHRRGSAWATPTDLGPRARSESAVRRVEPSTRGTTVGRAGRGSIGTDHATRPHG